MMVMLLLVFWMDLLMCHEWETSISLYKHVTNLSFIYYPYLYILSFMIIKLKMTTPDALYASMKSYITRPGIVHMHAACINNFNSPFCIVSTVSGVLYGPVPLSLTAATCTE